MIKNFPSIANPVSSATAPLPGQSIVVALLGVVLLMSSCSVTEEGSPSVPNLSWPTLPGPGTTVIENDVVLVVRGVAVSFPLINTGGIPTSCTVTPAFPVAAMRDANAPPPLQFRRFGNSCALAGTLDTAPTSSDAVEYTFSASNDSGAAAKPVTRSLEFRQGTVFTLVDNDAAIAAGSKTLEIFYGSPRPNEILVTNAGLGSNTGMDADSCALVVSGDTNMVLSSFRGMPASDGRSCVISGTPTGPVEAADGVKFSLSTTRLDDDRTRVTGMIEFPVTAIRSVECSNLELADAPASAPFPITTAGTKGKLFVRGNHSGWGALDRYLLKNKGDNILQARVTVDPAIAASLVEGEDYDPLTTNFKLASDDGSWTTQYWVGKDDGTGIRTQADGGLLPLDMDLPLYLGGAGVDNNWIALSNGGTFIFTAKLTSTTSDDGEKGTLKIERCTLGST